MLVPRRILDGTVKAASTESGRLQLNGIHLSRNGRARAQATDGRILIRTDWDEDDWSEYPEIGTCPKPEDDFSVILPSDHVKRLAKSVPKFSHKPILENLAINELPSASGVQVGRTDLECSSNETVAVIDGTFPDCDLVLNGLGHVKAEFMLNPARVIQAMEAVMASIGVTKAQCLKANTVVDVKVHDKGPVSFEHLRPGQKTTALVMPIEKSK